MKFAGRQPFNTTDFHRALTVLTNEGVVRIDEDIVFLRAEWEKNTATAGSESRGSSNSKTCNMLGHRSSRPSKRN